MSLIERLRQGVTWSDGTRIGAVVGEVNDPVMTEAAAQLEAMQAALVRAEAFIRDLATCDTMIMASTLIAEADALKASLGQGEA